MVNKTTDQYPHHTTVKPLLEEASVMGGGLIKTLLSLLVYVGVYYFFFRHHIGWILVIVGIILVHELGHFFAMKYFGYKDVQLFFIPLLGAFVSGASPTGSQLQRVLTLLAGPIPGILLGIALLLLADNHPPVKATGILAIGLNAFNLLPVKPLDGGQLLEKITPRHWQLMQLFFLLASMIASLVLALKTTNYFLLLLSWFLLYRLRKLWVLYAVRNTLYRQHVNYSTDYDSLSDEDYLHIRAVVVPRIYALRHFDAASVDKEEEAQVAIWVDRVLVRPVKTDMTTRGKYIVLAVWLFSIVVSAYLLVSNFNYLHIFSR